MTNRRRFRCNAALLGMALMLPGCAGPGPQPAAAPAPGQPADPGPFAPEPAASTAEIRADPRLRAEWRTYCDRIRGMAFIMIYPPPPGAGRLMADQRKCAELFPDGGR